MTTVSAISSDNITTIGVGLIVAVVVIGALLSFLLTRLIARVIILVVVIVLGVFVWQQRNHVRDAVNMHACNLNATFFGVHVDAPASVKQACRSHTSA